MQLTPNSGRFQAASHTFDIIINWDIIMSHSDKLSNDQRRDGENDGNGAGSSGITSTSHNIQTSLSSEIQHNTSSLWNYVGWYLPTEGSKRRPMIEDTSSLSNQVEGEARSSMVRTEGEQNNQHPRTYGGSSTGRPPGTLQLQLSTGRALPTRDPNQGKSTTQHDVSRHELQLLLRQREVYIDELLNHSRAADETNNELRKEIHKLRTDIRITKGEHLEVIQAGKAALAEKKKAEQRCNELTKSLDECMRKIIRTQPRSQKSDAQIKNCYYSLHQNISDWVAATFFDVADSIDFVFCNRERLREHSTFFAGCAVRIARSYPKTECLAIEGMILRFLVDEILRADRPCPNLSTESNHIILRIVDGIRSAEPNPGMSQPLQLWLFTHISRSRVREKARNGHSPSRCSRSTLPGRCFTSASSTCK